MALRHRFCSPGLSLPICQMGLFELFELLCICLLPLSGLGQVTILRFGCPGKSLIGRLESMSRAGSGKSRDLKGYDREEEGQAGKQGRGGDRPSLGTAHLPCTALSILGVQCCVVSCSSMLCCVLLCFAMLCHVLLLYSYVVVCCVILCRYVILYYLVVAELCSVLFIMYLLCSVTFL